MEADRSSPGHTICCGSTTAPALAKSGLIEGVKQQRLFVSLQASRWTHRGRSRSRNRAAQLHAKQTLTLQWSPTVEGGESSPPPLSAWGSVARFNGAPPLKVGKGRHCGAFVYDRPGFNGAPPLKVGKVMKRMNGRQMLSGLQWSPTVEGGERRLKRQIRDHLNQASMEPHR